MSIKLVVDSASDFTYEEARNLGIYFCPLVVNFGEKEYKDNIDIDNKKFYELLETSDQLPKTSQVGPFTYQEIFEKIIKDGHTVIAITISSKLSGTYSSARIAAESFPGKVFIVDSLSATIGEKILALYALDLIKKLDDPEEIVKKIEEKREKIGICYLLDTLNYLQKGGRLTKAQALAGSILSLKPLCTLANGEVEVMGKARGIKKGMEKLADVIRLDGTYDQNMPSMLVYSGNDSKPLDKFKALYPDIFGKEIESIPVSVMGPTIGTHVGPGTIGLAFFKK
nr:DegV family protein [uncultured Peptostreptococcus sp.]